MRRQLLNVDFQPAGMRGIGHRQCDDHGQFELDELLYKVQTLVQVGRIHHCENAIRRLRSRHPAKNHVDRNLFLKRMGTEPVRAWQVDEFDRLIVGLERADMTFDGDARIISDSLPQPRQAIEQCALPRIRTANNRNAGIRLAAPGNVFEKYAGFGGFRHRCRDASR